MRQPPHARRAFIVFLSVLGLFGLAPASPGQELEVHVLNVDQGLSVYVESPTGVRFLIDAGNPGDGTSIVRPYLQSIGVTALDYSLMTHWHTDHLGGLNDLFAVGYKPLTAAYDRGDVNKPSNFEVTQYMGLVAGKRQIPTIGQILSIGGGATIQITSFNGQWIGGSLDPSSSSQEENSRSMSVVIRYGDFDCYVGGDCTANGDGSTSNVEGPATAAISQVEVAVAAHHGSNTSSTSAVVANLSPSMVIQSAGHDNPYGHPTKTTTNRWNTSSAARVQWCTTEGDTGNGAGGFNAISGHVVIRSNGTTFRAARSNGAETIDFTTFEHPGVPAGAGQLAVSEVLVDPLASADNFGEWWEIVNQSASQLDLFGLKFTSGATTFNVGSRILLDPAERFVLALDGRMSRNGGVFSGLGAPWEAFALANATGSLSMKSPSNVTLETVTWGAGGFAVVPGASAERIQAQNPPSASNFATALTAWSGGDLGTPWAINGNDPAACPTPVTFGSGKLTSVGTFPQASYAGTASLYTNDFSVVVLSAVPNKSCIAFYGPNQGTLPFSGGTLYVAPPIKRLPGHVLDGAGSSSWFVPIIPAMTGTTTFYQFWFRDPFAPDGTGVGLSSALRVDFCPSGAPPPPPPVGVGAIIVTEFMKDPSFVPDSSGEYVELYNTTASPIDIEGWTLSDDGIDSHVINAGGAGVVIPAGQYRVLGINASTSTNGGVPVVYQYATFFLGNSGDEIVLKDAAALEIDRVNYTAGAPWPSSPGKASNLKAGVLDGTSNDNPANWCVATTAISGSNPDKGTPAQPNDTCP